MIRHHLQSLLLVTTLLPVSALAQYVGPGPAVETTAAATVRATDDTQVQLEGKLERQLRPGVFEFRDETGTVEVEIDAKDFPPQPITADTRVRLLGEVDRDWNRVSVDVDRLQVL